MNMALLGLLAETFIHPGAGQTNGVIDLPVSREAATNYPFIPGSSLKGALQEAVAAIPDLRDERSFYFGTQEAAGTLLVSDARLLLLPVRSLNGVYKWVTCPHLLERLQRDMQRSGTKITVSIPDLRQSKGFLAVNAEDTKIFLEERSFGPHARLEDGWVEEIKKLIHDKATQDRLQDQLIVLPDNDFAWFAQFGLAVQARNRLDCATKISQSLWYEETLPPDTLMYTLLAERHHDVLEDFILYFDERWLQVGGNETVGQGWFKIKCVESTS